MHSSRLLRARGFTSGFSSGFTLVELLAALVVLSLLGLMSFRGLGAVLEAREHVSAESEKWRRAESFFARFGRDVRLAAPRPVRSGAVSAAAWLGRNAGPADAVPLLEFSRFGSGTGFEAARRLGYRLNDRHEIELWVWPGLDAAPGAVPAHYRVMGGVREFELRYLGPGLAWSNTWPTVPAVATDPPLPLGVQVRLVLATGEEIVRTFAVKS